MCVCVCVYSDGVRDEARGRVRAPWRYHPRSPA